MKLTRREILATFLGTPFALAACRQNAGTKFPEGQFVGQNSTLGHALRENRNFEVAADKWRQTKVVIVGAGIAGLTAAWKFRKANFDDFVLLELESEVGGTSRSGNGTPVSYPWGAHYLPIPFQENSELIQLIEETQLIEGRRDDGEIIVKEQFLCREPEERLFYKGRWYEGLYLTAGASEDDKLQFSRFQTEIDDWVNWRDTNGNRAFAVPVALSSDDAEVTDLDKISFAQWLRQKNFNSNRLLWYCDYATRDDYGLSADQTSAWAGLFYFCSRVRKSGGESQPFITFPEGNGRFVSHLSEAAKARIKKSTAVVSIVPNETSVEVICFDGEHTSGFRCEQVIYASPIFTVPYVIRGFLDGKPFAAEKFQHNSWFVANLFLNQRPVQRFARDFPLAWDNVLYESPSLGYVTATHQKGIDYGPTILTYYYPMCREENGRTKLFNYEWRELTDVCLTDLSRAHPDIYDLCDRIDIMRWGHAMISPTPNFIWSGIREKAMLPFRNIHFAHSDLSGIALFEEAFYHGSRAADTVLKSIGAV